MHYCSTPFQSLFWELSYKLWHINIPKIYRSWIDRVNLRTFLVFGCTQACMLYGEDGERPFCQILGRERWNYGVCNNKTIHICFGSWSLFQYHRRPSILVVGTWSFHIVTRDWTTANWFSWHFLSQCQAILSSHSFYTGHNHMSEAQGKCDESFKIMSFSQRWKSDMKMFSRLLLWERFKYLDFLGVMMNFIGAHGCLELLFCWVFCILCCGVG